MASCRLPAFAQRYWLEVVPAGWVGPRAAAGNSRRGGGSPAPRRAGGALHDSSNNCVAAWLPPPIAAHRLSGVATWPVWSPLRSKQQHTGLGPTERVAVPGPQAHLAPRMCGLMTVTHEATISLAPAPSAPALLEQEGSVTTGQHLPGRGECLVERRGSRAAWRSGVGRAMGPRAYGHAG